MVSPESSTEEYTVYRRFSDFVWLSRRLRACRPWRGTKSTPMPPPLPKLPPKTFAGRKTHAIFLHERQALLADFLCELLEQQTEKKLPAGSAEFIAHFLSQGANQLPRGLRSPNAQINNGKEPYLPKSADAQGGQASGGRTSGGGAGSRVRSARGGGSGLTRSRSHRSSGLEVLTYSQWLLQHQSDTHRGGFRGSRNVMVLVTNKSIEWWKGPKGSEKHGPQIINSVRHTKDYGAYLESESFKQLVKIPLTEVTSVSYTESSRSFELWTQHHANYIFSAYVREWHNGGHEGAAKQAMDAAKFIADRLANIKVRKPSLKALLHRAPTTTEVEKDTEAYMRFCRATDMSGLAGLEVASHLAAEFVGKDSMEEGFELDLHWAADIWNGAGNGDLVDYGGFLLFVHGIEGSILSSKLHAGGMRGRAETARSISRSFSRSTRSASSASASTPRNRPEVELASAAGDLVARGDLVEVLEDVRAVRVLSCSEEEAEAEAEAEAEGGAVEESEEAGEQAGEADAAGEEGVEEEGAAAVDVGGVSVRLEDDADHHADTPSCHEDEDVMVPAGTKGVVKALTVFTHDLSAGVLDQGLEVTFDGQGAPGGVNGTYVLRHEDVRRVA